MMEIIHQIVLPLGVAATCATLPGALELLLVTTGVLRQRAHTTSKQKQSFSLAVIVPAHNEEEMIGQCVSSLFASAGDQTNFAVVVIADNCTDATALKARAAGARVLVRENPIERGKGHALRFGFDTLMTEGFDGFLVVDADSIISANLIPEITQGLVAGADAMQTRYRVTPPLNTKRKRLMDVALLAFNVLRPRGRDGWGLSAGILGNGFALSRRTLLEVPYSANSIVEDLEYHLLLVNARKKVRFAGAATVYGDMPDDAAAQLSQRARWEGGRAHVARVWIPKLALRVLRGEWLALEPLLELLTLPLAYLAVVAVLLCALPMSAFQIYGVLLVGLLLAHVGTGLALGGNPREGLAALATAPGYVFWKLARMTTILRSSRAETQWLRTPRAGEVKEEAPHVR